MEDEPFQDLVNHIALCDGGCARPLHDEIIGARFTWVAATGITWPTLRGVDSFEQFTMAIESLDSDVIVGHSTTMN